MNANSNHVSGSIGAGEIAAETLAGAAFGAGIGVLAGPPGVVAGAMIGGTLAAVVGAMLHEDLAHPNGDPLR